MNGRYKSFNYYLHHYQNNVHKRPYSPVGPLSNTSCTSFFEGNLAEQNFPLLLPVKIVGRNRRMFKFETGGDGLVGARKTKEHQPTVLRKANGKAHECAHGELNNFPINSRQAVRIKEGLKIVVFHKTKFI